MTEPAPVIPLHARRPNLEPFVDKHTVAEFLGCSVSWVEHHRGLRDISRLIAGKRKWRLSEVSTYIEEAS